MRVDRTSDFSLSHGHRLRYLQPLENLNAIEQGGEWVYNVDRQE